MAKKFDIGTVRVKYVGGTEREVLIQKSGRTIYIDGVEVHGSNRNSMEGIIHEIGVIADNPVEDWRWVRIGTDHSKLVFRRYKR